MDYYSAIKRNEVLLHGTPWMTWENTAVCERPITEDHVSYDSIYMKSPKQANKSEGKLVIALGLGLGMGEME